MGEKNTGMTPGPWVWRQHNLHNKDAWEHYQAWVNDNGEGKGEDGWEEYIFSEPIVQTDSGVYGPRGLDKSLIAAAPDLLKACRKISVLPCLGDHGDWECSCISCLAKDAVTKATTPVDEEK